MDQRVNYDKHIKNFILFLSVNFCNCITNIANINDIFNKIDNNDKILINIDNFAILTRAVNFRFLSTFRK